VCLTKSNNPLDDLFKMSPTNYGVEKDKYTEHLMEQYKLFIHMADKVSDRRGAANTFFLSLNSFLLTVLGILPQLESNIVEFTIVWIMIVAIAGVTFCITWFMLIRYYAKLNEAKFAVINKIEEQLPVTMYNTEWKYLDRVKIKTLFVTHGYSVLTKTESWIPRIIILLYISLATGATLVSMEIVKIPLVPA
jgi:hypothetical protein